MQACDRCHARKTRCDRRIPQCSACEKAGVPCLHADKLRQRNIPRGYIDNMESLVAQLREENQKLRRDLLEAQSQAEDRSQTQTQEGQRPHEIEKNTRGPSPDVVTITTPSVQGDNRHTAARGSATSIDTPDSTSTGGRTRAFDPFTLEVGYLTLTATGEGRFLGPSSGIDLASIISTIISTQSQSSISSINMANMIGSGMGGASGNGKSSTAITTARVHQTVPSDVRSLFPTLSHAMPYMDSYFQHTHKTFPLLHRPSFVAMAERVFTDPGFYAANTLDAFVFDMVMSIGSSNINRFGESASDIASKCYAMGQSKMQAVMEMGGMASLKAILLICHHGIFSSYCDTSASIWHLVGIGARLCIELGLHLKQRRANDSSSTAAGVVTFEEEMRRRCFWCLYNLDRVVSFTLGRPVVIRDEELNTPLPSPLDDSQFGPDKPIILQDTGDDTPTISPFLHVLHIRRTSGQILGMFYNARNLDDTPMDERRRVRREFELWLQKWHRETKNLKLSSDDDQPYGSCFTSPEWYTAIFNNANLLLYRPSPFMPHLKGTADTDEEMPDLLKLFHAARNCILSYSKLHLTRRLNYSWITMHGIFIAGLSFIYSVGRILQEPAMRDDMPDFMTVVDVTRACSNILAVICERWNVSRRSCELFNKLSNAVIEDTLRATVRRDTAIHNHHQNTLQAASSTAGGGPTFHGGLSSTNTAHEIQHGHANGPDSQQAPPRPYDPSVSVSGSTSAQPADDMLVMDEFRQFSETLDTPAQQGQVSYPSEMVFGFLQDWPFDLPYDSTAAEMGASMENAMQAAMGHQAGGTIVGMDNALDTPMQELNPEW